MELKHLDTKFKEIQEVDPPHPIDGDFKHYGVLGMKWGIRKQPDGSKARTGSAQDNSTGYEPNNPGIGQGGKPAKPGSNSSVKNMSDEDLQKAVNRLNLEQNYSRLTSPSNNSLVKKGASEVGKVFANSARNILTSYLTEQGKTLINNKLPQVKKK